MQGTARAPGTCGELVQGKINGINFLVTCPVDMFSEVTARLNTQGVVLADKSLPKVKLAAEKTLQFLGRPEMGAEVRVTSSVPCGKGMASSTADIAATCAAVAVGLGTCLTPTEIAEIALSIEPTDGLMFSGISLFDHVDGKACRFLGNAPALETVIVDLGGTIDTIGFNANAELEILNRLKEHQVAAALEKMERAVASGDSWLVGEAATESAFAHQQILFKPELAGLVEICRRLGGVGVNVAHSGTVVGLLFETGRIAADRVLKTLAREGFGDMFKARIIDGGVEVLRESAGEKSWQPLDAYMEGTYGKLRRNTG
ncbi:MAG: GHMP kinase [Firmicutes bacterium]|nr:GHMP kinase [Bacillota bacterium]